MTDFSRDPDDVLAENLAQGYVGMHFQQGVPILDRDLNLVQDLAAATVRRILSEFLGSGVSPVTAADGTAANDAFQIEAVTDPNQDDDFVISAGSAPPGRALVGGLEATIAADVAYSAQQLDALHSPATAARTDNVYLDVFLTTDESGAVMDNPDDIVVQTSVRLRPTWLVRVTVGIDVPDPAQGHRHLPLAQIARTAGQEHITTDAITDVRPLLFSATDLRRILLDPTIKLAQQSGAVGASVTISGRNFQFFGTEKVTVLFDSTPATVSQLSSTGLSVKVPTFNPPLTGLPRFVPVTVQTAYGTAHDTFRVLPS